MFFNYNTNQGSAILKGVLLSIALCALFLMGCGNAEAPLQTTAKTPLKYFDLKGFLEEESERLSQVSSFTKTVYVDGEQETKTLSDLDIETELMPFANSDINKPAWSDKYDIDSLFNSKQELVGLHYNAKDEKLKTKQLHIDFEENKVTKIFIENATNSTVANTSQTLIYQPRKGFSMESKQDISLMDENYFKIEVFFKP